MEEEKPKHELRQKWKKVAYGGMQAGYDDNYTDDSFLEEMVMNANVVKRDLSKVMLDSISISQYICIVALVVTIWTQTLWSTINEATLLSLDAVLLFIGFSIILLTTPKLSFQLVSHHFFKVSFFISGLYILAPIYQTLTRSISSDSIWALSSLLIIMHLFLHDYSNQNNPSLVNNISLNASIVSSVLVASRLPSWMHVFALMLFSLEIFLFAPLVAYSIKIYSFRLHLLFSFIVIGVTLGVVYVMQHMLFVLLFCLLIFVSVVCPYWLIRIQEYKFEINGPWDEAKLCFDITE